MSNCKYELRIEISNILNDDSRHSGREWNHLDEVYPGIYIGDDFAATDIDTLKNLGITHILNSAFMRSRPPDFVNYGTVSTDEDWYKARDYHGQFLGLEAIDFPTFNLSQFFETAVEFIEAAVKDNGKILVHCYVGMSRSATLVIVYLMLKKNMRAKDAIALIRENRAIYPNSGFLDQILDLEVKLRGGPGPERNNGNFAPVE